MRQVLEAVEGRRVSSWTMRRAHSHRLGCAWKRPRHVLEPDLELAEKKKIRNRLRNLESQLPFGLVPFGTSSLPTETTNWLPVSIAFRLSSFRNEQLADRNDQLAAGLNCLSA